MAAGARLENGLLSVELKREVPEALKPRSINIETLGASKPKVIENAAGCPRQRTTLINALHAHLAEFHIVSGVGRNGLERLLKVIEDGEDDRVPPTARDCLLPLRAQLEMVKHQILEADRRILAWHRLSEISRRLDYIPGVSPLIATALVASIPDPHAFKSGHDLAAWIGLVPKQSSTGGKERLGHIAKAGNRYLRMLLVVGALSVMRRAKQTGYTRRTGLEGPGLMQWTAPATGIAMCQIAVAVEEWHESGCG